MFEKYRLEQIALQTTQSKCLSRTMSPNSLSEVPKAPEIVLVPSNAPSQLWTHDAAFSAAQGKRFVAVVSDLTCLDS